MKIIDLFNKIANGEEVPEKIKYRNKIFIYDKDNQCYVAENYNEYYDLHMSLSNHKGTDLLYEVEIIEEENKKCTVETCCIGIEGLSKALLKIKDDMKSVYENIDKVETLEEEKKIPLKINKIIPSQNYVISDSKNNSVDERLEIIRKRLYANELYMLDIANTLNEIIDYLKSKGE